MIELKGIFKYYANKFLKTYVLRDVDLTIDEGEFVTIMGPSGAGKSTLLYILGMLEEANSGEYFFKDAAVHSLSNAKRTDLHKHRNATALPKDKRQRTQITGLRHAGSV
jgi:ABC-type lipoprotein export system ATPase subunit